MRWSLAKIKRCTIVLVNNFEVLQFSNSSFSDTVRPRNLKFILHINPYRYSLQNNFMFLSRIVFEKMWWYLLKIQSCTIVLINNFEILQVSIGFFSDTVLPRNLKFILYINTYGYSLQKKYHVFRAHKFREKCNDNLQLASHFYPILCYQGTWNLFCTLTYNGYSLQRKFHVPRLHSFREKCNDIL